MESLIEKKKEDLKEVIKHSQNITDSNIESLIAKIKEDFKEVIKYSQNIPNPKVDDIFDKWYENKQYFIKELLHGELIYEVPEEVYFEMSEKDKQNKVEDFITYVDFDVFDSYFYPNKKRIFIEFLDFIK